MAAGKNVILCEPHCSGYEHQGFNSSLAECALVAWPEAKVTFLGEEAHLGYLRERLKSRKSAAADRVTWRPIAVSPKNTAFSRRGKEELSACRAALALGRAEPDSLVIFCSVTGTLVSTLKMLMRIGRVRLPVLVVPHGVLNSLVEKPSRRWLSRCMSLRRSLQGSQPAALRYIALGESIYEAVAAAVPGAARWFCTIDHPYTWSVNSLPSPGAATEPVRFGYFGVSMKGFGDYAKLARKIGEAYPGRGEFVMVGYLNTEEDQAYLDAVRPWVQGVSFSPLSQEGYAERGASLTYAVGTASPQAYQLRASAAFLDAMAFVKPGIYLKNPWVEYYFDQMGDIGYLCDSLEGMAEVMATILERFPEERYRKQCENILRGRDVFSPEAVGRQLRTAVDTIRV